MINRYKHSTFGSTVELLNNFSQIDIESPADKIIRQIRDLISSGQLRPGDKLPSERMLCERLGVGRTHLRDAIKKLEFYGILRTVPQSGTMVAGLGLPALEGLITDMLNLQGHDFKSLVHTRQILEVNCASLASKNRTDQDLLELEKALNAHKRKVKFDEYAVEEDFLFHLKIAEIGRNTVLHSLLLIIVPDIISYFRKHEVCGDGRADDAVTQHEIILENIIDQEQDLAEQAMREHLKDIVNYVNENGQSLSGFHSNTFTRENELNGI